MVDFDTDFKPEVLAKQLFELFLKWFRKPKQQEIAASSETTGLQYQAEVTRGELGGGAWLSVFDDWREALNRQYGVVDEVAVELFDLTYMENPDKENAKQRTQTVAILAPVGDLPVFELRPRDASLRIMSGMLGMTGVTFAADQSPPADLQSVKSFVRSYFLSVGLDAEIADNGQAMKEGRDSLLTRGHDGIRNLFRTDLMRYFADKPGWFLVCNNNYLALWRPDKIVPLPQRGQFLGEVLELRQTLVHQAASGTGVVLPPGEAGANLSTFQGKFLGTALGLVLGLFTAVLSPFFLRLNLGFGLPFFFFGTILFSGIAGWFLGGWQFSPWIERAKAKQLKTREDAIAASPWSQPFESNAVVRESGAELSIELSKRSMVRGKGFALSAIVCFLTLLLVPITLVFLPTILRGEMTMTNRAGEVSTLPPWQGLLAIAPFWVIYSLIILAIANWRRREGCVVFSPEKISFRETTLFGTNQESFTREQVANVVFYEESKGAHCVLLIGTAEEDYHSWFSWRERDELKWLIGLIRDRMGIEDEEPEMASQDE